MVRACEVHKDTPLVRVPDCQPSTILRFMDTGAHGLHAPWVQTADQARQVVRSVKYEPEGNRGLGGVRAGGFMFGQSFADYCRVANEQTFVVVQIETVTALEQLPEIAMVEGVDALFIGPTDLSHSFGFPGEIEMPQVQRAMQHIAECCRTQRSGRGNTRYGQAVKRSPTNGIPGS